MVLRVAQFAAALLGEAVVEAFQLHPAWMPRSGYARAKSRSHRYPAAIAIVMTVTTMPY